MKLTKEDKERAEAIELKSSEVQEILGQVPKWIVRWGTLCIIGLVAFLVVASALLKYPDTISAPIQLTTDIPPAEIQAYKSGVIEAVLVEDQDYVQKGQLLAVIQSAANYKDVIWLDSILGDAYSIENLLSLESEGLSLMLGAVQTPFANFQELLDEYKSFIDLDYYQRKIGSINKELSKYKQLHARLKSQEVTLKEEYLLFAKQYARDSLLAVEGVISSSALEKSEATKLNKLYRYKETQTKLVESEIEVTDLQQEKLELELMLEQNDKQAYQKLQASYEKLSGEIDQWKKDYLISTPFNGQVSLSKYWSTNQFVSQGEVVITVVPDNWTEIVGKVRIDPKGAGKIDVGNIVLIKFDNYPHMEYGIVSGKVAQISLIPNQDVYYAEVALDSNRLVSNYQRELRFHQNMPGTAEIITENRTLLQRILDPFSSSLRRQRLYD